MNDSMNIEQYRNHISNKQNLWSWLPLIMVFVVGISGCKGTPFAFPQGLTGAPSRVPSPATGSYQVPGSYNGTSGAPSNSSGGLGGSSFGTAPNGFNKTSQNTLPVSNFINSISQAESQLLNVTNNARATVNRTADVVNGGVEQATARVDRLGQGVVQASNILTEAATTPISTGAQAYSLESTPSFKMPNSLPTTNSSTASNNVGDAAWRSPTRK